MFISEPLSPSDIIEILGIVMSLVTSIIAIAISVKTLKQNSDMIEESTRPYVVIYSEITNFQNPSYYLILKNFGQSGAVITSLDCDHDLAQYSYSEQFVPFSNIAGTFIAPGQSFLCCIDSHKFLKESGVIHLSIKYKANGNIYSDSFNINPKAYSDLVQTRATTKNDELKIISYALQNLVEKQL